MLFFRPVEAEPYCAYKSHGSRRGLYSYVASRLKSERWLRLP
jgi:hypothetical protein